MCVCLQRLQKQFESKTKCFIFTGSTGFNAPLFVTVQLMTSRLLSLLTYDEMISLFFLIATHPNLPGDVVFLDRVSGSIALKDY